MTETQERSGSAVHPCVWHVGGENHQSRLPLMLKLRERGFQIGAAGADDGQVFAEHDIPYWRYSVTRSVAPLSDCRSLVQLYRLFSRHKPDIVHSFDSKPGVFATLAARKAGVAGRVRTVTGMGYVFSSSSALTLALRPICRCLERRASRAANVTVFQNPDDQAYFRDHRMVSPGRDALVSGSGIDIEELLLCRPSDTVLTSLREQLGVNGRLVVTMIARLVRDKGVLEYFRAARVVRRHQKDVRFLLVGPSSSEGRQAVGRAEINEYRTDVHCLGRRDDVPALLAVTDVFVLPSYYREGIPRVLMEAGAMGLPLITTDMPGCREVVKHGVNGLLVTPRDVEGLVKALTELIRSERQRTSMGNAGRLYVRERFDINKVADAYVEVYQRVLREA